jgi:two-component system sensor histidine kinase HydH
VVPTADIEKAVETFAEISQDLLAAYEALARRAEHVERELANANQELAERAAQLEQQKKMAALGTMAGGIAHEIRNPLTAVKGFASLLLRELSPHTKEARWASRILEGVNETDAIIASLLSFARPERLRLELVDARALVGEAVAMALGATGERHERWLVEVECGEIRIRADRIQLRQALRNLIANAIEAQPSGGRVRVVIETRASEVLLSVADAGPGIAQEVASHAAEPFFTTRAEGTGLGLALVHTIVQLHGGRLEIAPEPSPLGGALVRLRIPHATTH